ncbi:hypothetical protein LOC68_20200 [Blastopirellula sp. JC732]|uniref:Uncharacterized protein n=1 Tax=Blastopirellula sediminis TaxID=2894196 RepID=A0A9X1MSA9_9BACT|nr:hypothetical protein [Blastopirellula sediminis]MCC9605977.1 hypothetical protein [Blastopirellula sediminis]MCC9630724.1 hypothetical protein [Blastopirellula sediminis]
MARNYAGVLGLIAFVTVLVRSFLDMGGIESTLQVACVAMALFAATGWFIGGAAERIVDESVRERVNQELDKLQRELQGESSGSGNASA